MTNEFLVFLKLLTASARNLNIESIEKFDIKKLKALEEKLSFYTIESEEYESFSYSNGRVYKYIKR